MINAQAMILGPFPLFRQSNDPNATFWSWFQVHEKTLYAIRDAQDPMFSRLLGRLHKVDPDLCFEIGSPNNGQRELILSAGGLKRAFAAVESLANAAPQLPRWRIIKFRPRRLDLSSLRIDTVTISPKTVLVSYQCNPTNIDVTVFLGHDRLSQELREQFSFLFLDQALGEFDVETYLGAIHIEPHDASSHLEKVSLEKFVREFQKFKKQFN
ncbi:MAG TPA: hypothetical protein VI758_01515 [Bacteroidota bacterium]